MPLPGATTPILQVNNLHTHFKTDDGVVKAVDGVSFALSPGEIIGVVGESGSGKSVMSLSIMGLIPRPPGFFPEGEILFDERDLLRLPEKELRRLRGKKISMIFQDPMTSLNPYLTVERQLTEVLELHEGTSHGEARTQSIDMLARVGIPDPERRMRSYPHELSGGMRQRVMIAMMLLCRPEVLIADEPTTALDVTIQAQILELMKSLQRDLGTSIILITHDLGVVAGMADRVLVMYAGRVVESGSVDAIFSAPQHPYTRGLLQSVPRLDGERRGRLVPIPGLPPDLSALPAGCPFRPRCSLAVDRCAESYPPVTQLGGPDRFTRCWRVEEAGALPQEQVAHG